MSDPGPGGLASAFTYAGLGNPPSLVAGDLILLDPGTLTTSDIIRFNARGAGGNPNYDASLVFYSIVDPTVNAPADTGLPSALYTNAVTMFETTLASGVVGIVYTPTDGQPGFVARFNVTYTLISEVPEPATAPLCVAGLVVLSVWKYRRRAA